MSSRIKPLSRFGSRSVAFPIDLFARRFCLSVVLGLFAALAFAAQPMRAAVTEAWVQRYNGPANGDDRASAVAADRYGNVVVTGTSYSGTNSVYYTAKYAAADGTLLWEKRYNGPINGGDRAHAAAVDGSGNVVVTGESDNGINVDFYTAKYAATNGALLWEKRYATLGDSAGEALAVDPNGNVVVTGPSNNRTNGSFNVDCYTAKYAAADGELLWEQRYNGPANGHDYASALAVDTTGNVVVTGSSATVKYASTNGALLWTVGGGEAVAVDASGNVVVTRPSATIKYASTNGELLWQVGGGVAVAVDADGNVVVTDSSEGNYYTAKYAANGAMLWEKRTVKSSDASAVAVDAGGNVVVTGIWQLRSNGTLNYDFYTIKYAGTDGALLWERRYGGWSLGDDVVGGSHGLALGPDGMIVVTGYSYGSVSEDYATVVYRETLPAVSIEKVLSGVRLRFPGVANHTYQVQSAPTVTGPWSENATLTTGTNGLLEYIDTNAPSGSAFYRTASVP